MQQRQSVSVTRAFDRSIMLRYMIVSYTRKRTIYGEISLQDAWLGHDVILCGCVYALMNCHDEDRYPYWRDIVEQDDRDGMLVLLNVQYRSSSFIVSACPSVKRSKREREKNCEETFVLLSTYSIDRLMTLVVCRDVFVSRLSLSLPSDVHRLQAQYRAWTSHLIMYLCCLFTKPMIWWGSAGSPSRSSFVFCLNFDDSLALCFFPGFAYIHTHVPAHIKNIIIIIITTLELE